MKPFWHDLPRPFTVLAPMEGITDVVFRQIITEIGKPDVFFTEFTSVEGLNSPGSEKVKESLRFENNQSPIVAQIWGRNPDAFYKSAKICYDMGFGGIDINMGCPDRIIVKRGSCAALIKNPDLAKEIIIQTKKGAGDLPVSVKTRLGYLKQDLNWIKLLLAQDLYALTIHLRTVEEMSKVPAHWEVMPEIIRLRDEISPKTLIIGNGDIMTFKEIDEKFEIYHCDGFMVGRGIFQNPWFFNKSIDLEKVTINERLDLFIKHINLFDKTWVSKPRTHDLTVGSLGYLASRLSSNPLSDPDPIGADERGIGVRGKNPVLLKKFCKIYINNFADASDLRVKIMACSKSSEMIEVLNSYGAP